MRETVNYRIHKGIVKAVCWAGIAFVTLQCLGRGKHDWHLSPAVGLLWAYIPTFLLWFFLRFKRPHLDPTDAGAPPWAATRDDFTKLLVVLSAAIMIEFVFRP